MRKVPVIIILVLLLCLLSAIPASAETLPMGGTLTLPDGYVCFDAEDENDGAAQKDILSLLGVSEDELKAEMAVSHCRCYGISRELTGELSVCFYADRQSKRLFDLAALREEDRSLYAPYAAYQKSTGTPPEELRSRDGKLLFFVFSTKKEDDEGIFFECAVTTVVGGSNLCFYYTERGGEALFAAGSAALKEAAAKTTFSAIPPRRTPLFYAGISTAVFAVILVTGCVIIRTVKAKKEKECKHEPD